MLADLPRQSIVCADLAYDSNRIDISRIRGGHSEHPAQTHRVLKSCISLTLYKGRHSIEHMFCRPNDYRLRIYVATATM